MAEDQYIPEVPRTVKERYWVDYRKIEQDKLQARREVEPPPEKPPPEPQDRLRQVGPKSDTYPEKAAPSNESEKAAVEAREEYLRDEREMAEQSVVYRAYYRGGIGQNLDVKV